MKQVALAIPYGAKSSKIAAIMGFKKTIQKKDTGKWEEIPNFEKGVEWRDKYLTIYHNLNSYMEESEKDAYTKGWTDTIVGRKRHFKYAPFIHKVILECGLEKDKFLDMSKNKLDDYSLKEGLTYSALVKISDHFGIINAKNRRIGKVGLYKVSLQE